MAGFERLISIPVSAVTHSGPRTFGDAVQSSATEWQKLQGEILGDPDFDLLRITAGTDFGLPSPGHTTLARLEPPGSDFQVDSFFDIITYRIECSGAPGSYLQNMSGSTTGTVRMSIVPEPGSLVLLIGAAAAAAMGFAWWRRAPDRA